MRLLGTFLWLTVGRLGVILVRLAVRLFRLLGEMEAAWTTRG